MSESFLNGRVTMHCGDCLDVLATLPENSIDSCVTDPPYGLQFMGREWDKLWRNETEADAAYVERTNGELTSRARKLPDYKATDPQQMQEWHAAWARQVYRVLKPGAHLLAFGGTRTYHRMACAIEDAGFEIRDQIQWLYGSGFPKSHDVSKGIDAKILTGGSGPTNLRKQAMGADYKPHSLAGTPGFGDGFAPGSSSFSMGAIGAADGNKNHKSQMGRATGAARQWQGWGTALKPACEPIVLARKPLSEKTVAANVLKWGTGAINVDGCRVEAADQDELTASREKFAQSDIHTKTNIEGRFLTCQKIIPNMTPGRWPANVIHDGSEEVVGAFPESGPASSGGVAGWQKDGYVGGKYDPIERTGYDDNGGSAARFFYSSKADADDRLGSKHPTVKPLDLMQYLVRLITPKGGTVLDPFTGTGTTGEAAWREGMKVLLIEREADYQADIRRRMALCLSGPDERQRESIKAKLKDRPIDHGPLFGAIP